MKMRPPQRGMVIRYSYLWHRESNAGHEEGRKDRPCAIVLTSKDNRVVVAPITHTRPTGDASAVELPAAIGKQLGLDDAPSWVVTNEINHFQWPGHDVRPAQKGKMAFGQLSDGILKKVTAEIVQSRDRRLLKQTNRDEKMPKKDWSKKVERSKPLKKAPLPKKDKDRSR